MPRSGGFRAYAADPVCSVGEASRLHAAIFPNHGRELSKIVQPGLRMLFEVGRVRRGLQEILRTPRRVPATIARQIHASSSNIKRSPYFLLFCFCSPFPLHASILHPQPSFLPFCLFFPLRSLSFLEVSPRIPPFFRF